MELRARGWSVSAAGREVGVSRTSANNWARGYKTYRRGEAVGFVPALDRLAVRQISNRYLSEEERIGIADLRRSGLSIRKIADKLGRAPSTVSRELRRNSRRDGQYRPFEAHRWAVQRRARRHQRRVDKNPALCDLIAELLASTVEPPTDRPAPATRILRGPIDVVMPRKHLSSCVSTALALDPATAG
jgi:transposase, IS30 family